MKEGIREPSYKGFYFKLNLHLLLVCKLNYLERSFTYGTRCIINVFFYVFSQLYILPLSTLIHNKNAYHVLVSCRRLQSFQFNPCHNFCPKWVHLLIKRLRAMFVNIWRKLLYQATCFKYQCKKTSKKSWYNGRCWILTLPIAYNEITASKTTAWIQNCRFDSKIVSHF